MQLDLQQAYGIDMLHGACHCLCSTRLEVNARSIQKLMLRSYFAGIDQILSCMMTDASCVSEDDLFVLTAVMLSLDFA